MSGLNGNAGGNANGDVLFDGGNTGGGNAGGGQATGDATQNTGTAGDGSGATSGGSNASGTGQVPADWRSGLPAEFRDDPVFKNVSDVPTLAKNYLNAQRMIGADKIVVPGAKATPEDWKQVYTKLGVPEKLEDYKLDLEKEVVMAPEFSQGLTKFAHENGILPRQMSALVNWFSKENEKSAQALTQASETSKTQALDAFKQSAGEQAYAKTIADAKRTMQALDPELAKYFRESGMGRDVNFVKAMASLASGLKEGSIKGDGNMGDGKLSAEEAQAKISEMKSYSMSHPYNDASHPDHAKARAEIKEAFAAAYPEPKQA